MIRNGVVPYRQRTHTVMAAACPVWGPAAAHSHGRKLLVLQSVRSNRQIQEEPDFHFLPEHAGALTETFNSNLADVQQPLLRQRVPPKGCAVTDVNRRGPFVMWVVPSVRRPIRHSDWHLTIRQIWLTISVNSSAAKKNAAV